MAAVTQSGICLYDQSGLICSWSKLAQAMLGYSENDVLGQSVIKRFPLISDITGPQTMALMTKEEGVLPFVVEKSELLTLNDMSLVVVTFVPEEIASDKPSSPHGDLHREEQSGVYDTRSISAILSHEARMIIRYKQALSMVVVRINGYDQIDSLHGHGSTDIIVQTLAIILKNETRDVDAIGRLSNDLFVVCLPNTKEKAASHVAARIARVALRYSDDDTPFTIKTECHEVVKLVEDWQMFVDQLINE